MMEKVVKATRRSGRLAQLVRAPALQAGSRGFESLTAHHIYFIVIKNQSLTILENPVAR
jgi:hypothetical protein